MISCAAARRRLSGLALGETAGDELLAHVGECSTCALELQRRKALADRMLQSVETQVRRQPPERLTERILAGLPAGTARSWTSPAGFAAAFAACAAGLLLFIRLQPPAVTPQAVDALSTWRSPTVALLDRHGSVLDVRLHSTWFTTSPTFVHPGIKQGGPVEN